MGFHLFYEVTNNAPLSWTQPMMHVAQVIAMDASDKTRKSWINQADLIRKTRFESWDGVGKILKKLASSGYEFRVPVCTDKNGKLMYAKRGYALNYLVPVMSPTEFGRPGGRANYEVRSPNPRDLTPGLPAEKEVLTPSLVALGGDPSIKELTTSSSSKVALTGSPSISSKAGSEEEDLALVPEFKRPPGGCVFLTSMNIS